ncbi:hypothetical protein MM213_07375 [Belliella sp. R4-6]|uniref:Lipoprotein n=1 Tax=Belliella alkalica TaxID=1730871 RepID=A0ABS9VA49_9BACT|nr:hypothetical protein [Belliella alkalica]MCH7413297.1 hypothetical protein [Belliella alkalica]
MTKYLYIFILVFLASCGQPNSNSDKNDVVISDSIPKTEENNSVKNFKLTDKIEKFLWREDKYDEELKDTFNTIVINEELCKTLTEPEIAVLGYVGTYIGSECKWDGEYKDDRSNLKCKILTALNLGYQCSDRHLGFLRKWFKNDKKVLEEFDYNCPTTPYTASSQNTFDEITLIVKGNNISVWFSASGINMPMGESWNWTETDHFKLDNDYIRLIKKDKSKVKREHFDTGE